MKKQKRNLLGKAMAGKYTDVDTLLNKINSKIGSGKIQVSNDPIHSPMNCLQWDVLPTVFWATP